MNIFWIGLICIIVFLMYQYRNLEIKYKRLLDKDYQNINKDKIINKIFKIFFKSAVLVELARK